MLKNFICPTLPVLNCQLTVLLTAYTIQKIEIEIDQKSHFEIITLSLLITLYTEAANPNHTASEVVY